MIGIVVEAVDVDETLKAVAERERLLLTCAEQLGLWTEQRIEARREYCPFDPWSKRQLKEAREYVHYYRARIDSLHDEIEELERQLASEVVLLLLG